MKKLLQNRIAESKLALPVAVVYAAAVWLLCGLITEHWWVQAACFAVTTYLMVELNNSTALIRIYSRLVSCAFLLLSCAACFLFPGVRGAVMQICMAATYLVLFQCYQDKQAVGKAYYAFCLMGVGTMACPQLLYFVPLTWLLMGTNLMALSWRTWGASVLGLLTPYWFGGCWLLWKRDLTPLADWAGRLTAWQFPVNYGRLGVGFMVVLALLLVCTVTGIVHYLRKSYNDKIRIRMLFGCFIWTDLTAIALICVQPAMSDMLLRLIIINTAPLIAHFLALTSTRATNWAFCILTAATLAITAYNVWTTSSLF